MPSGAPASVGASFEEERHRNLQDVRDVLGSAGADSICTLFVFLHLLECQAKGMPQFLLSHVEHQPAHAHTVAHILVSWVCDLLCHTRLIPRFFGRQRRCQQCR